MSTVVEPSSGRGPAESPSPTSTPAAAGASPSPALPLVIAGRVARALARRWPAFLVGCLVAGLSAFAASLALSQKTWEATTTLLYTPLPIPEDQKGLYASPDLKTLTALVNSPPNLERLIDEFTLGLPLKAVEKNLTVVVPNGTKMVNISLKWDDGPATVRMLNRLAEVYVAQVADLRRRKIDAHIGDYRGALDRLQGRLDAAQADLRAFHRREELSDWKSDLAAEVHQVQQLEAGLTYRAAPSPTIAPESRQLDAHLEEVRSREETEGAEFDASAETVADNRRRQDRIAELITEERKMQEVQAQLEAKRQEYARMQILVDRKAASPSTLDAIRAEVGVLASKVRDTEKIREWKAELERIDKVVVPAGSKKKVGSPIIQQILFRKLELDLQHTGIREEGRQVEEQIRKGRDRIARLEALRPEVDALTRRIASVDEERQRLEEQIAAMNNLRDLEGGEFVVVSEARQAPYPVSSNKKQVLGLVGGLGVVASLLVVVGLESLAESRTCEARARRLGLPALATVPGAAGALRTQAIRGLALRLRQYLTDPGALVLFSTLGDPGEPEPLVDDLAACLARRDERVLIVDARLGHAVAAPAPSPAAGPSPASSAARGRADRDESWLDAVVRIADPDGPSGLGLADYLAFSCNDPDEICRPTDGFGVDRLELGRADVSADALATHRMAELLAELRPRYSLLLVIGPALGHGTDLQILAAHAQGLIAVIDRPAPIRPAVRHTLADLDALGAPVLGQVVIAGGRG